MPPMGSPRISHTVLPRTANVIHPKATNALETWWVVIDHQLRFQERVPGRVCSFLVLATCMASVPNLAT